MNVEQLWRLATARDRRNEREPRTATLTDDDLLDLLGSLSGATRLACGHPAAPLETYRAGTDHWCAPCRSWRRASP